MASTIDGESLNKIAKGPSRPPAKQYDLQVSINGVGDIYSSTQQTDSEYAECRGVYITDTVYI